MTNTLRFIRDLEQMCTMHICYQMKYIQVCFYRYSDKLIVIKLA